MRKRLGRTELLLSPFGAGVGLPTSVDPLSGEGEVMNWCDIPGDLSQQDASQLVGLVTSDFHVQLRIGPDQWDRRMTVAVDAALARLGRRNADWVQLAPFDLERIKAGEPFRRLQDLRDAGRARFFSVWVNSVKDAQWVMENTPAQTITIHAPHEDKGWPELFELAAEADTGIIATPMVADGNRIEARRMVRESGVTAFTWPV
jgi:hypothetical protein